MGIYKATEPATKNDSSKHYRDNSPNHTSTSSVVLLCASKESNSKLKLDGGIFGSFEATEQLQNNYLPYIIFSTSRGTFFDVL